ncbi:unnamed protein product [Polarella glacialis]|uniref:Uncharacterized protein n=1 Tax=Polarella glacialis TaxID=89957 RepID=A0A813E9M3_POLGL|nr:unnamed protein product [Polarella glacialis]
MQFHRLGQRPPSEVEQPLKNHHLCQHRPRSLHCLCLDGRKSTGISTNMDKAIRQKWSNRCGIATTTSSAPSHNTAVRLDSREGTFISKDLDNALRQKCSNR